MESQTLCFAQSYVIEHRGLSDAGLGRCDELLTEFVRLGDRARHKSRDLAHRVRRDEMCLNMVLSLLVTKFADTFRHDRCGVPEFLTHQLGIEGARLR